MIERWTFTRRILLVSARQGLAINELGAVSPSIAPEALASDLCLGYSSKAVLRLYVLAISDE